MCTVIIYNLLLHTINVIITYASLIINVMI